MAHVEVILKENFPQLGWVGDRVRVRRGFARNWLIPKNIAVEASARNRKQLEHHVAAINAKKVRIQSEAEELRTRLENCSLHFKLKVGKGGKAFGSISARDIQAELAKQGFELDRRQIKLGEPIREARDREVQIKLHAEVSANVRIAIEAEQTVPPKETKGKDKRKRKASKEEGELQTEGDSGDSSDDEFDTSADDQQSGGETHDSSSDDPGSDEPQDSAA